MFIDLPLLREWRRHPTRAAEAGRVIYQLRGSAQAEPPQNCENVGVPPPQAVGNCSLAGATSSLLSSSRPSSSAPPSWSPSWPRPSWSYELSSSSTSPLYNFLTASRRPLTAETDLSNIARSDASRSIST